MALIGFTLGKYAPFHRGHQYLFETALSQVDHLVVMIYGCEDLIDVSLEKRANWIRYLYPSVEIILAPDGPMKVGDTPRIKQMHEDYILRKLKGRKISRFYSSEFYGEHVSKALGADDVRVDPNRSEIPISATAIRKDYYGQRKWLDPIVYYDLIKKVVFLGAPSTGKTTLASLMAKKLNTAWMPEYGREYWEKHQKERRLSPDQLLEIANEHIKRENELVKQAKNYLFVDTNALTTSHFAHYYHGGALPELSALADKSRQRYQQFFLCEDDIPYDDTWDRSGQANRSSFQHQLKQELETRGIDHTILTGSIEQRVSQIEKTLVPPIQKT